MEIKLSFKLKLNEINIQGDSKKFTEKINKLTENYEIFIKKIRTIKTDFSLNDKNVINKGSPVNLEIYH